ncbi:MAG: PhzF family phenazine biosynthesis protein, partial [Pararhizobium sp.]
AFDLDIVQVFEEKIGPVRCAVRLERYKPGFCEFDLPRLSVNHTFDISREEVAAALGVGPHEIGFENHVIGCWSAGVPYVTVPLHNLDAVGRAHCDAALWEALAPMADGQLAFAYVYCRGGLRHEAAYHARMFAPHEGMAEDPATGSAVAALSGAIHRFDGLLDGHHTRSLEQGVEMGRPSLIHLHIEVEDGAVAGARIGGHAVKIAEGRIDV